MRKLFLFICCSALLVGAWGCDDDNLSAVSVNGGESFLSLDGLARSGKITVNATTSWEIVRESDDDWFTLSAESGSAGRSEIEVIFEANDGQARTARLTFVCGEEMIPFRLSQSAQGVGFDDADYYFYVTFGTMPTLYAGLHVLSHDKPSYVFYERTKTFVPEEFPANAVVTTGADRNSIATADEMKRMRTQMLDRIREINEKEPTAVFGLYVDDLRCRLGYDWFVAQGIDSARVRVSMLSDGTGTYNNFAGYFGDPATAEKNWTKYARQIEALDWNHGGRYPQTRSIDEFESWTWPFGLSTLPGYRLLLQDANLLESSGPFITEQLARMQMKSVQPYELLASLSQDAQARFYRMASFDYDKFAQLFDASPKKNLVIIGTSHKDGDSERLQRKYVERIVDQYGEQYDIFFKPHPADKSSADYQTRFGLTLLPGQMPFEIFVWSLIDKVDVIGGYQSTVFLTVPVDKVKFLFAANAASLVRPLNLLFKDVTDIEWIQ